MRVLADAALQRARDLGAEHADFRFERLRSQSLSLRDARLEGSQDGEDVGFAVRVIVDGAWGFAAAVDLTVDEAVRVTDAAVDLARTARPLATTRVEWADEPVYPDVTWVSTYDIDPFTVPTADKVALLAANSERALAHGSVEHIMATLDQVQENTFYADIHGTM